MKLDSMSDWMDFFSSDERIYIKDNYALYAYGDEDQSYIVIESEVSSDPVTCDRYVFHCEENSNPIFSLFCFLEKFEFSFNRLVETIENYKYEADVTCDFLKLDNIEIAKYKVTRGFNSEVRHSPM